MCCNMYILCMGSTDPFFLPTQLYFLMSTSKSYIAYRKNLANEQQIYIFYEKQPILHGNILQIRIRRPLF